MLNKKAFLVEALIRIIIAGLLLFAAVKIGFKIGNTIFGGREEINSFDGLVETINSMEEEGQLLSEIVLNKGSAIIGIGKGKYEFICQLCPEGYIALGSEKYSFFKKPNIEECQDKSCLCLCKEARYEKSATYTASNHVYEIKCSKISCKALNFDIPEKIELENFMKVKGITQASYPYWEGGFFYSRLEKGKDVPSNGILPYSYDRKTEVVIEKSKVNDIFVISILPTSIVDVSGKGGQYGYGGAGAGGTVK